MLVGAFDDDAMQAASRKRDPNSASRPTGLSLFVRYAIRKEGINGNGEGELDDQASGRAEEGGGHRSQCSGAPMERVNRKHSFGRGSMSPGGFR